MKRFLIQITDEEPSYYDPKKQVFLLSEEEYADFYNIITDLELITEFDKNTIVSCDICDSIVINAKYFYFFIMKVLDLINNDVLYEIRDHLIAVHLLSDEEWGIYLTVGLPDLNVVKENNVEMTDTEGNLFVFVYDEIGIITDPTCSCNHIITTSGRGNE